MQWRVRTVCLLATVALAAFAAASDAQATTSLSFHQLTFDLDGVVTERTDWGGVSLTFDGYSTLMYFNLTVDGSWQVQNMPLMSTFGPGLEHTVRTRFDLGCAVGDTVASVSYGYDITTSPLASAPLETYVVEVTEASVRIGNAGRDVTDFMTIPPPAEPMVCGLIEIWPIWLERGFWNQPCGDNECAPTAVSNSLLWLNFRHGLGIDPAELTIAKMKTATGWEADGCWIWHEETHDAWWETKAAYMEEHNLPITTRKFDPADIDDVIQEMNDGQDVELEANGHTVMVTSIAKVAGDDKYVVTYAHDPQQNNNPDDPTIEQGTWDQSENRWTGSAPGNRINYFVVECPEQASSVEESSWGRIKSLYR
jgi:hypothetical protein